MSKISFRLHQGGSVKPLEMEYQHLFAIGYAGRNMEKTMEHIRELERDLGVPAPKKIPTIFECSNLLLTQEEDLQFVGNRTCGEVEYIILVCGGKIYIGVGSDHTDRELEGQNVLKAKQICPQADRHGRVGLRRPQGSLGFDPRPVLPDGGRRRNSLSGRYPCRHPAAREDPLGAS